MKELETKLAAELRRGVLQIAVLALLRRPAYGYQLLKDLGARGLETEEGTLYPILRRLEQQSLVTSTWDTEGARPRKYYRITETGLQTLDSFLGTWRHIHAALEDLVRGEPKKMPTDSRELQHYLDEVAAHLGRAPGRSEMLLELRSAILDRAEDLAGGEPTPESLAKALEGFGDPVEVSSAFGGERYLIGPRLYRAFWVYTSILFAAHLVMIVVASVMQADFELFPVMVGKAPRPYTLIGILCVLVQAFLLDVGLVVMILSAAARVRRTVKLPRVAFRVEAGARRTITRAVLAALVLVLLNFFRDDLFIVVTEDHVHPLFNRTFGEVLPLLNVFLLLIVVREIVYAIVGERRPLVAADALLSALGVALMIWLLTKPTFVSVPGGVNEAVDVLPSLNLILGKVLKLILITFAVAFGMEAVKRILRFRQL